MKLAGDPGSLSFLPYLIDRLKAEMVFDHRDDQEQRPPDGYRERTIALCMQYTTLVDDAPVLLSGHR
jgi:hypothetical protein